jgi:hypothetical protein
MQDYLVTKISTKQNTDTGLAILLILLVVTFVTNELFYTKLMLPVLLITMISPKLLYPFAVVWLSLSKILGTLFSKIILTFIFFIMVVPIGFIRRILGKDNLKLREFKKDKTSVFINRDYLFTAKDLEKPF